LEQGGSVCLAREISPQAVLELIDQRKSDVLITVGTLYKLLVRLPEFPEKSRGKVRLCVWGGSKMTAADLESIEKSFGAAVLPAYGLTECSAVVSLSPGDLPTGRRSAAAGRIHSCQEVGIWLKERGFLGPGETGEIVVKGTCLMNGYLGLPREEQPIDDDGWLHTGDLGRIAEDGLLELKGRMKDLIKCAGENIAPGEIEEALLSEPSVAEARVFGIPDPVLGERVEACVVLRSREMDERRLRTSLRKKLSPHKVPVHVVAFPAFPVSANGKTDQIWLRKMLMQRMSEMSSDGRL
jgi:fatty-acyl-CoA synthase